MFSKGKEKEVSSIAEEAQRLSQVVGDLIPHQKQEVIQAFRSFFIKKAKVLMTANPQADLVNVIAIADKTAFLWSYREGLNIEDGFILVRDAQNAISLSDWIQDKEACIDQIKKIKKYLEVKDSISQWVQKELKRIQQCRYAFLMSSAYTERKLYALVMAGLSIEAAPNLSELCLAISGMLLHHPDIYNARNYFVVGKENQAQSQTKVNLLQLIAHHGLDIPLAPRLKGGLTQSL